MIDEKLLARIKELANSSDWRVREDAAAEIKKINDKSFVEYLPVWQRWAKDPNPNIRRTAEVGLLRIKAEFVLQALDLLELLLFDDNVYVRKNCGPFALSAVGYKDPVSAFKKLKSWIEIDDRYVRWNVAMSLGVRFGQAYPAEALKLLKELANDEERFVWRAASSSIVKLIRNHPELQKEVLLWDNCEECLNVVKKYIQELR